MLFLEAPWDVNQNNGRILFLQLVGVEMGKVNNLTEGSETVYKNVVNDRKSNNLLVKGRGGGRGRREQTENEQICAFYI